MIIFCMNPISEPNGWYSETFKKHVRVDVLGLFLKDKEEN